MKTRMIKISDYGSGEFFVAWKALLSVTNAFFNKITYADSKNMQSFSYPFLKTFLNAYWLRPENALNRSIEANIISRNVNFFGKVLDAGCGDGIFTSLLFGGVLSDCYDAFYGTKLDRVDIFDSAKTIRPQDVWARKPRLSFMLDGIDLNKNMVRRAELLKVYQRLEPADVCQMPLDSERYDIVFSNVLKNVPNVQMALSEISRVLKKKGLLVAVLSTDQYPKQLFYYPKIKGSPRRSQIFCALDRGRGIYNVHSYTKARWTKILHSNGFKCRKVFSYLNSDTIRFWDTGFRPFSVLFLKEFQKIRSKSFYIQFKSLWTQCVFELLKPYYYKEFEKMTNLNRPEKTNAYLIIIAEKLNS